MAEWIAVVDDDVMNLKVAGHILGKHNKKVTPLGSGQEFLAFIKDNAPDIVLLDINMPGMDGFETLKKLREYESQEGRDETPVIFLTADDDINTENRGFAEGVSDYIRKPFDPGVLIRRIDNILGKQEKITHFREEATRDKLTGFFNKAGVLEKMPLLCRRGKGCFMMIDLDSFKLVNDIYGHDMGDKVLVAFADTIREVLGTDAFTGRMGGDEFTAFSEDIKDENDLKRITVDINAYFVEKAKNLMGNDMDIPLGASIGAVFVSGSDFDEVFKNADKALYKVKQNGKHGYGIFSYETAEPDHETPMDLKTVSMILAERNIGNAALQLEKDSFTYVYRFVMRYIKRYHKSACKILFTVKPSGEDDAAYEEVCAEFCDHVKNQLRKSDLVLQFRKNQIFIFLTDCREDAVSHVIGGIMKGWGESKKGEYAITYETEFIEFEEGHRTGDERPWIAVVDDDAMVLRMAENVLAKNNMRVSTFRSADRLLDFLKDNCPSLILLDVNMPDMDGFALKEKLSALESDIARIPVIFITGDDDADVEKKCLKLGATDFVKKPFVPEVLIMRVRRIIDMVKMQNALASEVDKKSRENESLMLHVVESLADAIDAKDSYTNGHSGRVAEYAREIAKRYGYDQKKQDDIYMMGLLHDVGKIGVPDEVINKPGRLTDEEFELIKKHPVVGSEILLKIKEMPELALGARWHHERYDGTGYPDSLRGSDIPEQARIIAVADAYDAMTSKRSYREILPQEKVRDELLRCSGTQFDPRFARIMVQMIDEDKNYEMKDGQDKR